jgi:hypothetical protein
MSYAAIYGGIHFAVTAKKLIAEESGVVKLQSAAPLERIMQDYSCFRRKSPLMLHWNSQQTIANRRMQRVCERIDL